MDLLFEYFPNALCEVAKVCEFGAYKYGESTWQELPSKDILAALGRHICAAQIEELDPESKLCHEAHMAWNALAIVELWLTRGNLDA